MKCPNCCKDMSIYITVPPKTHLSGGKAVLWCEECGTVFINPDGTNKVKKLLIPRQSRPLEEGGPHAFSGLFGE